MKYLRTLNDGMIVISDKNKNEIFRIEEIINPEKAVIRLYGELHSDFTCELEDELTAAMTVCKNIRLDMIHLDYISNAGLKYLLQTQKEIESFDDMTFALIGVSDKVMNIFEENDFIDLFEIEKEDNI